MLNYIDTLPRKLQYVIAAAIIVATLCLVSLVLSALPASQTHSTSSANTSTVISWGSGDSPNVVATGLGTAANVAYQTISSTGNAITNSARSIGDAFANAGHGITSGAASLIRGIGSGFAFTGRMIGSGLFFAARMVGSSLLFVVSIPFHIMGYLFDTPVVSAMIRPAGDAPVPVIDVNAAGTMAPTVLAAKTVKKTVTNTVSSITHWPIHGAITTLFGVPEWPYEPIHTGLDISDGAAPGVTRVHAFKAGKVIATIHSGTGLGNHVIIDHGGGLTSVYGHLNSISVRVGQQVDIHTVVGYEGTTGVSTGTHLHFEIRLKGAAVDPQKYITGQP